MAKGTAAGGEEGVWEGGRGIWRTVLGILPRMASQPSGEGVWIESFSL